MKISYSLHLESNSEVHVRRHSDLSDVGDACVLVLHQGQRCAVLGCITNLMSGSVRPVGL